ncbi:DivIVA domain-containing protein [Nocardioides sp. L-11A]|uniref:DivIVA domain-containing protein n=1 Tax=Nocardioides sp. L-11A TaxID=3043848 RepID=UPI00249BF930|nr:DivIVA domain-containing protein [Nocardioides sp. L-11A]
MNRYYPNRGSGGLQALIREARFRPVRIAHGYDMGQVDELLDRLVEELDAGRPVRPLVKDATFGTTRWREGYHQTDVDTLLTEVTRRAEA